MPAEAGSAEAPIPIMRGKGNALLRGLRVFSRGVERVLRWLLTALSAVAAVGLVGCAWSQRLPAQEWPLLSCAGMVLPMFLVATVVFVPLWLVWPRHRALVAIPLTALLLSAASVRTYLPLNWPTEPPAGSVKVMTYNVFNLSSKDKQMPLTEHPSLHYILASGADIVCCQESNGLQRPQVDTLLAAVYPFRRHDTRQHAQFTLLSKFPILSMDSIPYEGGGNGSFAYRLLVEGDTVLVVNNHLASYHLQPDDRQEYKDIILRPRETDVEPGLRDLVSKVKAANAVRGPQADSVARYVERAPERYKIVCGDFNAPSISYPHWRLTRTLNDAYTRAGNGPGISYHLSGMYFRIDNILLSPSIRPYKAVVDPSTNASDHYPLSCHMEMKNEE